MTQIEKLRMVLRHERVLRTYVDFRRLPGPWSHAKTARRPEDILGVDVTLTYPHLEFAARHMVSSAKAMDLMVTAYKVGRPLVEGSGVGARVGKERVV